MHLQGILLANYIQPWRQILGWAIPLARQRLSGESYKIPEFVPRLPFLCRLHLAMRNRNDAGFSARET